MKLLVLIATLATICSAAPPIPDSPFDHPSPINPNVLVESKPEDKITRIANVDVTNFNQETSKPFYPTALPEKQSYHIKKHEDTYNEFYKATPSDQHKRDIPVPLVAKHKHPEVTYKSNSEESKQESEGDKQDTTEEAKQQQNHNKEIKVEMSSGQASSTHHGHELQTQHPTTEHLLTAIPKDSKHSGITASNLPNDPVIPESSSEHPVNRPKPIPVEELFARHHE